MVAAALVLFAIATQADAPNEPETPSVGLAATITQIVLPGPELEAIPLRDRAMPVVVRVAESYRHGDAFRYDLEYYGLEPGTFDLKDYLQRKDGTSTADLPPIPVTIRALRPPGQIQPNPLEKPAIPGLGGYRWTLIGVGTLWVLGLAAILATWPSRKRVVASQVARPATLADRLRPLVEQARSGTLPPRQFAELERLLIGYWRKRLNLDDMDAAQALLTLKRHDEAGPLIRQVEDWLHRPGASKDVDIAALLEPYREPIPEAAGANP